MAAVRRLNRQKESSLEDLFRTTANRREAASARRRRSLGRACIGRLERQVH